MPRLALTLLASATLAVSCVPYQSPDGAGRLLVDQEAPRYGRIIQHGDSRSIPIVRGDGIAELFVPVQIGASHGWWQIDTGAALCVVTSRIARDEHFAPLGEGEIVTAAGSVDSQLGILPSVRLGGLEIRDLTALSLDDEYANDFTVRGRHGQVLGILGADLLDHLKASIDLRANVLRLRAP